MAKAHASLGCVDIALSNIISGQGEQARLLMTSATNSANILSIQPLTNNGVLDQRIAQKASSAKTKEKMHSNTIANNNLTSNSEISVDQKLVARVQSGDKKAFDLLVIKYQGKVASVVSRYVGDRHEIADVTQEAFIKAYRALKGFRGDSAFYTWIYRIAINCAKNYLASKGRRPPSADIDINEAEYLSGGQHLRDVASPEAVLGKQQLEHVVKNAIKNLPEDLRVALTLREFDGLSYDEIAAVMSCPVGTVRSRIFRARETVDKEISVLMGGDDVV